MSTLKYGSGSEGRRVWSSSAGGVRGGLGIAKVTVGAGGGRGLLNTRLRADVGHLDILGLETLPGGLFHLGSDLRGTPPPQLVEDVAGDDEALDVGDGPHRGRPQLGQAEAGDLSKVLPLL